MDERLRQLERLAEDNDDAFKALRREKLRLGMGEECECNREKLRWYVFLGPHVVLRCKNLRTLSKKFEIPHLFMYGDEKVFKGSEKLYLKFSYSGGTPSYHDRRLEEVTVVDIEDLDTSPLAVGRLCVVRAKSTPSLEAAMLGLYYKEGNRPGTTTLRVVLRRNPWNEDLYSVKTDRVMAYKTYCMGELVALIKQATGDRIRRQKRLEGEKLPKGYCKRCLRKKKEQSNGRRT